jgi:hypothetical protein
MNRPVGGNAWILRRRRGGGGIIGRVNRCHVLKKASVP